MNPPRPIPAGDDVLRPPRRPLGWLRGPRRLCAAATAVFALCCFAAFPVGSVAGAGVSGASAAEPGSGGPDEYKLKAAFLYNFVRFTTWPKEALGGKDDPIVVLVVGEDRFGDRLDDVFDGKRLHDRSVVIRRVGDVPEKIEAQLVFSCGLTAKQESALLERCEERAILTMADRRGFAQSGGCANFFIHEKRVRFQVNPDEVNAAGMSISAKLLKLAEIVETERDEESQGGDE